jgi:hypothetical protein
MVHIRQVKKPILTELVDELLPASLVPAATRPADIISYAVWLYYRFNLSHRRCAGPFIEDLLAERGSSVSREAIRLWCIKSVRQAQRFVNAHAGRAATARLLRSFRAF